MRGWERESSLKSQAKTASKVIVLLLSLLSVSYTLIKSQEPRTGHCAQPVVFVYIIMINYVPLSSLSQ